MTSYGDKELGQHWLRYWLVAWRHQAITWTKVDLSSVRSSEILPRAISQKVSQPSTTVIGLKISSKSPKPQWVKLKSQEAADLRILLYYTLALQLGYWRALCKMSINFGNLNGRCGWDFVRFLFGMTFKGILNITTTLNFAIQLIVPIYAIWWHRYMGQHWLR